MKKRLSQDIEYQAATTVISDEQIDLILKKARSTVPDAPPLPPTPPPSLSYYLRTAEGRVILIAAAFALFLTALPSILSGRITIADAVRFPIALIIILAGVFAIPARHTASLAVLRLSALVMACAAIAAPFVLPVLDQPAKIALLWPALTALFATTALTTAYLVVISRRATRQHQQPHRMKLA